MSNVRYLPTRRVKGRNYILTYRECRALGNTRLNSFIFSRRLVTLLVLAWLSVFAITWIGVSLINLVVDFHGIAYYWVN